ncbi:MAG: amidohydrolase family protein [Kangiellaceae bacterium]|nr:amidohydrolase family protein [Kangiellaceae bacterium]
MQRRKFLKFGLATGATAMVAGSGAWYHYFDGPVFNPCLKDTIPESLMQHSLMLKAFEGIDFSELWDSHFHLLGNGTNPGLDGTRTGVWLSPQMTSLLSPIQRIQYAFYLDAACIEHPQFADREYVQYLSRLSSNLPGGVRFMLLAFDYNYSKKGVINREESTFYIPNQYAAKIAATHSSFEWIASVHPYRGDAIEQLEWCKQNGARAVKWLPPAMNIDPSSRRCEAFYNKLVELNLPLVTHAGDEKAVHSEELQKFANPLLLRKPLDLGVKVIVAHCASLGSNRDIENKTVGEKSNFELFARLMNDDNYANNCLGDISAINLINREPKEIRQIIENQDWHSRLLYASDFPLPGVMPIISSKNLASNGLIAQSAVSFLNDVRPYSPWLYDFLIKRLMQFDGLRLSTQVFQTQRHFEKG